MTGLHGNYLKEKVTSEFFMHEYKYTFIYYFFKKSLHITNCHHSFLYYFNIFSGPTWSHKEGQLFPTVPPGGGGAQQLCETLQLQQHERQQDGELLPHC